MAADFIALDVETANADLASICAIGLVHFRSGEVYRSLTILVDPRDDFAAANIAIHGITPEMVVGRPTIADVLPVIRPHLENVVVAHHSPFDRGAIRQASARHGIDGLGCAWLDTLQVARRTWAHLGGAGGYGLKNCATFFGIDFKHHDAAEDARCAGLLLLRAIADSGRSLERWTNDLWAEDRPVQPAAKPASYPARVKRDGAPIGPLCGETVVFTGNLSVPRAEAADMAAAAGATVIDHINRKTTILVVGNQDLRATKGELKSSKHRKAEQLTAEGLASIRIIQERDFTALVT